MGPSRRLSAGARPPGSLLSQQELQKQRRHQQRSISSFFSPAKASKQPDNPSPDSIPTTAARDVQPVGKAVVNESDSPNVRNPRLPPSPAVPNFQNSRRVLKSAVGGKGGGHRGGLVRADARTSNSDESKDDELWTDHPAKETKTVLPATNRRKVALQIPPLVDGPNQPSGAGIFAPSDDHGGRTAATDGAADEDERGAANAADGDGSQSMGSSMGSDLSGSLLPAGRLRSLRRRGGRSNGVVVASQESGGDEFAEEAARDNKRTVSESEQRSGEDRTVVEEAGLGVTDEGKNGKVEGGASWCAKGFRGKGPRKRRREEASIEDGKGEEGANAVGKRVQVYWPDDKAWYAGAVVRYEEETGKHQVRYDDGESEMVVLAKERVRWMVGAGSGEVTTPAAGGKGRGGRRGAEDAEKKADGGEVGNLKRQKAGASGGAMGVKGRVRKEGEGKDDMEVETAEEEGEEDDAEVESSSDEEEEEDEGDTEEEDWLEEVKRKGKKVEEEEEDDDDEDVEEEVEEEEGEEEGKPLGDVIGSDEEEDEEEMECGRWGKKASQGARKKSSSQSGRGKKAVGAGEVTTPERKQGGQGGKRKEVKAQSVGEGEGEGLEGSGGGLTDEERSAIRKSMLGSGVAVGAPAADATPTAAVAKRPNAAAAAAAGGNRSTGIEVALDSLLPELAGEAAQRFSGRMEAKFDFLYKNRRDGKRRPPSHPDYDPTTLFLPDAFLKSLSEGQRQWWQFKAMHLDKVLLFKMGKFYELFEMDAHIGAKELDLQYMKGDQPHCGFPEKNYADNAERLARKGYRVVVVEQVETPEQLEQRRRATGCRDKVVRRAVCAMVSRGTMVDAGMLSASPDSSFILSLSEFPAAPAAASAAAPFPPAAAATAADGGARGSAPGGGEGEAAVVVGVAVVDASTGRFSLGQFLDDPARTRLRSLSAELRPVELVLPRPPSSSSSPSSASPAASPCSSGSAFPPSSVAPAPSPPTLRALSDTCRQPLFNWVERADECWTADATAAWLRRFYACGEDSGEGEGECGDGGGRGGAGERRGGAGMPGALSQLLTAEAAAAGGGGGAAAPVLSALGGLLSYLRSSLLESRLLALRRVSFLPGALPPGCGWKSRDGKGNGNGAAMEIDEEKEEEEQKVEEAEAEEAEAEEAETEAEEEVEEEEEEPFMVLDSCALENLEILENSRDGTASGSLFSLLDRTVTPFGRRLLRQWLVRPLLRAEAIRERQRAVEDLMGVGAEVARKAVTALRGVGDLDRLLPRIHSHWARAFPAAAEAGGKSGKQQQQDQQQQMGRNAGQVVLYEDVALARVREFTTALRGCQALLAAADAFTAVLPRLSSSLLRQLLSPAAAGTRPGGRAGARGGGGGGGQRKGKFPAIAARLRAFEQAFDWAQADACGRILPLSAGVDAAFDAAAGRVRQVEAELQQHLEEQRHILRAPPSAVLTYATVGKDPFQLEVPDSLFSRVPATYELKSQKKGVRRFWTPVIKAALPRLAEAKEEEEAALRGIYQRLLGRFCSSLPLWLRAVNAIAQLDALLSLASFSLAGAPPMCRPCVGFGGEEGERGEREERGERGERSSGCEEEEGEGEEGGVPYFRAKGLRHAVLATMGSSGGCFVPNDSLLGGWGCGQGEGEAEGEGEGEGGEARMMLLTGPNMGGKSTLIRQMCLAVILAQLGAHVPAESLSLSPVDRVFVRMGARDHIMAGRSTFLVELQETASMLRCASRRSFVALDELGRGTATSDGHAIAHSVLEHLLNRVKCIGVFSTHYHALAHDFQHHAGVSLKHMACRVRSAALPTSSHANHNGNGSHSSQPEDQEEKQQEEQEADGVEEVVFLYRLAEGSCPKSYGINVARLAGMPESVLCCAAQRAHQLEQERESHRRNRLAAAASQGPLAAAAAAAGAKRVLEASECVAEEEAAVRAVMSQVWQLLQQKTGQQQGMEEGGGQGSGVLALLKQLQMRVAATEVKKQGR